MLPLLRFQPPRPSSSCRPAVRHPFGLLCRYRRDWHGLDCPMEVLSTWNVEKNQISYSSPLLRHILWRQQKWHLQIESWVTPSLVLDGAKPAGPLWYETEGSKRVR